MSIRFSDQLPAVTVPAPRTVAVPASWAGTAPPSSAASGVVAAPCSAAACSAAPSARCPGPTGALLAAHVPLSLLMDLASPRGPRSDEVLAREGGQADWLPAPY